jgi:hypothetical protein
MNWINNYRVFTEAEYKREFSSGDMWKNGKPGACGWLEGDMSTIHGKRLTELKIIYYPSELNLYLEKEFIKVEIDDFIFDLSFDMLVNITEERQHKLNNV